MKRCDILCVLRQPVLAQEVVMTGKSVGPLRVFCIGPSDCVNLLPVSLDLPFWTFYVQWSPITRGPLWWPSAVTHISTAFLFMAEQYSIV